jgi:beta-N-acetylhexosaminidase
MSGRRLSALAATGAAIALLAACSPPPAAPRLERTAGQGAARASSPAAVQGGTASSRAAEDEWVRATIHGMGLPDEVGQLFMTFAYGSAVDDRTPAMVAANRRLYGVDDFAALIGRYHPGGIVFITRNVLDPALSSLDTGNTRSPAQVAELTNGLQRAATSGGARIPLLISADQEQGLVNRVPEPATQFPGQMALGATRSSSLAAAAAEATAQELRAIGINEDLAPVADVNVNQANPVIGVRSFGSDPSLVAAMTGAAVAGYQRGGVAATAKHFPGHGDTDVDSHTGLPVIPHNLDQFDRIDLPPFRAALQAGVDVVMTAHIVFPALDPSGRPASLSRPIVTGLLRQRLGFDGVVMTDSLWMAGVRRRFGDADAVLESLKAGTDILLMPPDLDAAYHAVMSAVHSGLLSKARLDQSVERILRLKWRLGLIRRAYADPSSIARVVGSPAHRELARTVAARSITMLTCGWSPLPLPRDGGTSILVVGWGAEPLDDLAGDLRRHGASVTVMETGLDPAGSAGAAAAAETAGHDLVIAATMDAWRHPGQQALVQELSTGGVPVIVATLGDPYDAAGVPEADAIFAAYSFSGSTQAALADALYGAGLTGRLPVSISGEGRVLFPLGAGLDSERCAP